MVKYKIKKNKQINSKQYKLSTICNYKTLQYWQSVLNELSYLVGNLSDVCLTVKLGSYNRTREITDVPRAQ